MTVAASFRRSEAWNSPSALITFARRSRSASACLAIARCIPDGISTSLTSTIETLIPQGAVASSMIPWRIALIFSRSESSSSMTCWPSTDRRVVCAICEVATLHPLGGACRAPHVQHQAVLDPGHLDRLARRQLLPVRRPGSPELAADRDEAARARLPDLADDLLRPHRDRASPRLHRLSEQQ